MSSRKVRVKKLNHKTALPVLREDQIDPTEYEALASEPQVVTGVEKAEEEEYHLQSILRDAGTSNNQEIPVPPPQESSIDYDGLYPSAYQKPSSYIRYSSPIEEVNGCEYDMTREDDVFLKSYNATPPAAGTLFEDDFERVMDIFERTAADQTPFASVDNTVIAYDMMVPALHHLDSDSILQHAKAVYEFWQTRRQEQGNKPLNSSVKFETHQETDDADPYVCFRRREARQTRKTRARDNKIAETLKKLRRELEDGRQLVLMSYEREMTKRDLLHMDQALFEERCKLKNVKVKLGIRSDDEYLINQKPQKRKPIENLAMQRPAGPQRHPTRPDGRTMDADLITLAERHVENERLLRLDLENKIANHRRWNQNHIDLTTGPLSPVKEQGMELKFRPAKTQYLMTPPASISSDSMEIDEAQDRMEVYKPPPMPVFQFKAGFPVQESLPASQPAFRRRIGRLGRLWIDRRGLAPKPRADPDTSDRWKYDSDSDEEEPTVYELDPYDTRALEYRTSIPLNPYLFRGRPNQPVDGPPHGSVPTNRQLPQPAAPNQPPPPAQPQPQPQTAI